MINNYKQIRSLLLFERPNDYYLIELVKRKKDHPRQNSKYELIKEFYVYSLKEFDDLRDTLLCWCEVANARAYIYLNTRNAEITSFNCMKRLASNLLEKNYLANQGLFRKVSETIHFDFKPKYLIDINEYDNQSLIKFGIEQIWKEDKCDNRYFDVIRTPNGYHIIASVFNLEKFRSQFPKLQVLVDSPTILYSPVASVIQVENKCK